MLSNQDTFTNGGWWHDNRILAATGEGIEKEEPRAWEGWWNEKVVELVRLSVKQPDAMCVLLTGRSEQGFAELVRRIVQSKGLDFDMISLKPKVSPTNQRFQSTMHFKQLFLNALMETYRNAEEIKVYEDRPKHTKGFREFFEEWNARQRLAPTRGPLLAEVVQVAEIQAILDPVAEVAEVQRMINAHNETIAAQGNSGRRLAIKKTVFFTSYTISPEDSKRLRQLAQIPSSIPSQELMHHGNQILICPRPASPSILEKVGGMGSKMRWEVTSIGSHDNSVWAAGLRPVPSTATYHTANHVPLVVLALRKGTRPIEASKISKWYSLSPEQMFTFETVVGEKNILRVEPDDPTEGEYESLFATHRAPSKRKFPGEEDRPGVYQQQQHSNQQQKSAQGQGQFSGRKDGRGYHTGGRGGRGRGGNGSGGGGGGGRGFRGNRGGGRGGGGRGRGGGAYKSLDDVDPRRSQGGPQMGQHGDAGGQGVGGSADLTTYY
ncbi:hypothetical protein NLU13_8438 [Sarocladium strictum]|uniref:Swiss Army Knife RNA repair protein HAD domain-containing protein n=1 Tax=Sarocladium strictum TaxID=5046 RepID=A0AA39GC06_SARSR|nr:hypothetical protein NLU13_8438 [Sarocladium strictum]